MIVFPVPPRLYRAVRVVSGTPRSGTGIFAPSAPRGGAPSGVGRIARGPNLKASV
jgi:hypothetical protein